MNALTVAQLHDIVSRAHSVIAEAEGADEHHELLTELKDVCTLTNDVMGGSHMGCAANVTILEVGETS